MLYLVYRFLPSFSRFNLVLSGFTMVNLVFTEFYQV